MGVRWSEQEPEWKAAREEKDGKRRKLIEMMQSIEVLDRKYSVHFMYTLSNIRFMYSPFVSRFG